MKIKIDHVNLSVVDLNQSIEWYDKIFGFKVVEQGISPMNRKWAIIANNDSMICMTEFKNKILADKNDNEDFCQIYHFGLRIADIELWKSTFKKYSLKLDYGGAVEYPHSTSWYIRDPSGHKIEVSYTSSEQLQFS